ncbi:MAG: isoamylase [Myxococcota bacterium]|jgi:isoamylase
MPGQEHQGNLMKHASPFLFAMLGTSVMLALTACPGEDDTDRIRLYFTEPLAPDMDAADVEALEHLGPIVTAKGINFGVYSANATRIDVLLFDDPEAAQPTRQFEMVRFGDVWNLHVQGVGYGQHYGYVAWGPNWPHSETWIPGRIDGFVSDVDSLGNRFNPNKLLIDPYALAVHRDHDWSKGSLATGPARTESTYAAAAKSVVVESKYVWSDQEAEWMANRTSVESPQWNKEIIYEVHLRGFTMDPSSGVEHPGTYRGFGEKAEYLKDLGITAVELLPIHEKPHDGGYWGYQSISFFAPEFSYSAAKDPLEIIDEFKWMVDELHKHGIAVYLDVVYNHTGEGGLWREKLQSDDFDVDPSTSADLANFDPKEVTGLYSFRGLDNASYYALTEDNQLYWQATGVGNQTRSNHLPFKKLTLDSLRFYVEELHVDGFRFDLAPVLGASDDEYARWDGSGEGLLDAIIEDPTLQAHNTRIIAEPWAAGGEYAWKLGGFPADGDGAVGWYEWNAWFRDWWRSFVNEDDFRLNTRVGDADGGFTLTGSESLFSPNGRRPYHSVNFVTVHDGFTMYDLFSYNTKQNACGPLNPTCCENEFSVWCDADSGDNHNRSRDWDDESTKRQMMRNLFVAMMIAHGTPHLLGGDEWMRTQLGNNNAYSTGADNAHNWYQWGTWQAAPERSRMHDFVRNLTAFRRDRLAKLSPTQYGEGPAFSWKGADNSDTPQWGSRHVMIHYTDDVGGPPMVVLINMERGEVQFTLPPGNWTRLIDTQTWFDSEAYFVESGAPTNASSNITLTGGVVVDSTYGVTGSSIVVLESAPE